MILCNLFQSFICLVLEWCFAAGHSKEITWICSDSIGGLENLVFHFWWKFQLESFRFALKSLWNSVHIPLGILTRCSWLIMLFSSRSGLVGCWLSVACLVVHACMIHILQNCLVCNLLTCRGERSDAVWLSLVRHSIVVNAYMHTPGPLMLHNSAALAGNKQTSPVPGLCKARFACQQSFWRQKLSCIGLEDRGSFHHVLWDIHAWLKCNHHLNLAFVPCALHVMIVEFVALVVLHYL